MMASSSSPQKVSSVLFFYGRITREQAEIILKTNGCKDGLFLLRESINPLGNYAISICNNNVVCHYNIEKQIDGTYMIHSGQKFMGPLELIMHHRSHLDGFVTKPHNPCNRLSSQLPVAFRGMTYEDFENELSRTVQSIKGAKLNKASGSRREKLIAMVCMSLHEKQPWYHAKISRVEAENRLLKNGHTDGKFLVRLREDNKTFALSVSHFQQTKHYMVDKQKDGKLVIQDGPKFDCLIMLIDHYHNKQDGLLCKLTTPCCSPGYDMKKLKKYLENSCDNLTYLKIKDVKRPGSTASPPLMPGSSPRRDSMPLPLLPSQTPPPPKHLYRRQSSGSFATNGMLMHFTNRLGPIDQDANEMEEIYSRLPRTRDAFELSEHQLEIHDVLGSGQFGDVKKGLCTVSGGTRVPVAIKMLKNQDIIPGQQPEILKEAGLMRELSHKHIVRMIGLCNGQSIMLVLELAPLGPLSSYLKTHKDTPQWNIVELMMQVAKGMQYLESKKFVHRDLAARNVLLVSENFAKISDFGMSKALGLDNNYYEAHQAGKWPLKWYAPECIYFWKFDSKSDVWSYGITMWEAISHGRRPYGAMKAQEILQFVVDENKRLSKPEGCDDDVYRVMLECWEYDKADRPNFSELANKTEVLHQKLLSEIG